MNNVFPSTTTTTNIPKSISKNNSKTIFAPTALVNIQREYIAGPDCQVYINKTYVDDAFAVRLQVTSSMKPIIGYTSEFIDDMTMGNEIVAGQIILFKVIDNPLGRYVNNDDRLKKQKSSFDRTQETVVSTIEKFLSALGSSYNVKIPGVLEDFVSTFIGPRAFESYNSMIENLGPDPKNYSKEVIDNIFAFHTILAKAIKSHYGQFLNLAKRKITTLGSSGFSLPDRVTGINAIRNSGQFNDWNNWTFSLQIFLGVNLNSVNPENELGAPIISTTITGCRITGASTAIANAAEPLAVAYSFMGRSYSEEVYSG